MNENFVSPPASNAEENRLSEWDSRASVADPKREGVEGVPTPPALSQNVLLWIHDALDEMTDGFILLDRECRVCYLNRVAWKLLPNIERIRKDVIGASFWELIPEARGSVVEEEFRRALMEQVSVRFEVHHSSLGEWYDVRAHPSEAGLSIFYRDITEEKKLREGQKEGDKWFRTITENLAEGLGLVDSEGRNLYSNPANLRMHRYRDEEEARALIPRFAEVFEVFDLEGRRLPVEEWPISHVLRGETVSERVVKVRRKDIDHEFYASYNGTPVFDDEGKVAVAIFSHRDITQQIRLQEWLQASEEQYRVRARQQAVVAELGQWALTEMDLQSLMDAAVRRVAETLEVEYSKVLELLPGGRELFLKAGIGWREGLVGHATVSAGLDSQAGYTLLSNDHVIVEDLRTEKRFQGPSLLVEHGVVSGISVIIQGAERPWGVMGAHTTQPREFSQDDIHFFQAVANVLAAALQRRSLDDELRERAQALERADEQKNLFLAMLAHELRNPLAPILSAVELMRLKRSDESTVERSREMIDRQVRHLSRLVDDLLNVSRMIQGKVGLRKEVMDLGGVVSHAAQTVRPNMEARGHEFNVLLPLEPISIVADPTRLEEILLNMLNNAAKFTPPGGRVVISAQREREEAVVRVRDTGIGIASDLLPHVFDLFTQADTSLDRSQGGLGLGLTLVKNLVDLHGGSVSVSSGGLNQGAEFTVRLPAQPPVASAVQEGQPPISVTALNCHRILVVDDNRDAADSLAEVLQCSGNDVRAAYNGSSALEALKSFQPQIVLLDIGLPGMDGYEVARRLRAVGKEMKIAALSGYAQTEDRQKAQEAGFDIHFTKPVEISRLMEWMGADTS